MQGKLSTFGGSHDEALAECLQELKAQQENDMTQEAHEEADRILCRFLTKIGYQTIVEEFEKIEKWYA